MAPPDSREGEKKIRASLTNCESRSYTSFTMLACATKPITRPSTTLGTTLSLSKGRKRVPTKGTSRVGGVCALDA